EANAVAHVQLVIEFEPAGIHRLIDSLPWLRARAVNRKLGMMRKVEARHGVLVNRHSGAKTDVGLIRKIAVTRHTGRVRKLNEGSVAPAMLVVTFSAAWRVLLIRVMRRAGVAGLALAVAGTVTHKRAGPRIGANRLEGRVAGVA